MKTDDAPRAGSLAERAIELLKSGPLRSMDLAERLGTKANAIGTQLERAIERGFIAKTPIRVEPGTKGNRTGVVYSLPSNDDVDDAPPVRRVLQGSSGALIPTAAALAAANPFGAIARVEEEPPPRTPSSLLSKHHHPS